MITFSSAGESHGPSVVALLSGVPAGFAVDIEVIDEQLKRRQKGYGRGQRMNIEADRVRILSGIRGGVTIGSPVALMIENRDFDNWKAYMDPGTISPGREVVRPRPGHADLAGALKYDHRDMRNVLERASARETAARVAAGAVARAILADFDIRLYGYVVGIGGIRIDPGDITLDIRQHNALNSPFSTPVADRDDELTELVDRTRQAGDTLGGVVEVVATGVPVGLGGYDRWDARLDGRLAQATMSVPAIKGVEVGDGFRLADGPGSRAHDEILYREKAGFYRETNHAGGLEGGVTNGQPLVVRAAMKPIPTLMRPLKSVDIDTKEQVTATAERSDVCAVPAAAVVVEAMVALTLIDAFLEKFGGDCRRDIHASFEAYGERILGR
jgi:chorismate synthase